MYRVREGGRKKGRKDRRMRKKEGGRERKEEGAGQPIRRHSSM